MSLIGGGNAMSEFAPCKADLQDVAARQKKQLDGYINFQNSINDFIEHIGYYEIERIKINSLMELMGFMEIIVKSNQKAYNNTLKQIEDENK